MEWKFGASFKSADFWIKERQTRFSDLGFWFRNHYSSAIAQTCVQTKSLTAGSSSKLAVIRRTLREHHSARCRPKLPT